MPTKLRRITVIPDAETLATLGHSPMSEMTASIFAPLKRFARLVECAAKELDSVLTPEDWKFIGDQTMHLGRDPGLLTVLILQAVEKRPALVDKLKHITPLQAEAVLSAVYWLQLDPDRISGCWWLPDMRRYAVRAAKRADARKVS